MPTISLCMIVKNEEKFLEQCLLSVKDLVNEIIVVDTGSSDKTKEIALKFTDKIFDFNWCDDFSAARNVSLKHATCDWILVLDADETISKKDCDVVKQLVETADSNTSAFYLTQRNYNNNSATVNWNSSKDDKYLESKVALGFVANPTVRLFRRGIFFERRVHETVTNLAEKKGKVLVSPVQIHHYGLLDKEILSKKMEFYEKIQIKKASEDNDFWSYYELGRDYLIRSKVDLALENIKKSIDLNKDFFDSWFILGNIYQRKNNLELAKKSFLKSLDINKNHAAAHYNLGIINFKLEDFTCAINNFINSISIQPKNAAAHYNLGLSFYKAGNHNKAKMAFENAIELNPNYAEKIEFI